jgi:chromosomal replication initiator protein
VTPAGTEKDAFNVLTKTPVKDALRAHLARRCAEEELRSWYDPLLIEMDPEENCLTVTFPHHLFGSWFAEAGQASLESCLSPCLGKDIPVHYQARQQHARSSASFALPAAKNARQHTAFGENFTLKRFLINKKNFFPLAVAREVAKPQKEPSYNPLVYYGKSGCGKTHLLRAIANELSNTYDSHAIFYGALEKFTQECEQQESGSGFDKYQAYCIDDIHLFANNFSSQEKLLGLLNACLQGKKQFVCACSGPLVSHRGFSESLRTRLELGIIVELKNPDIDVRMRFAQAQCVAHGVRLAQEHMLLLAQRCEHLRYLSGVMLKIAAYKNLARPEITKQDIEKILKNSGEHSPVTPQDIVRRVAEYFSLSPEEITGNKRTSPLVFARQTAMYLCREIFGLSYPALGQLFGGKDHSTIMYGIKKIEKYIVMHKDAHTKIAELQNMCVQKYD